MLGAVLSVSARLVLSLIYATPDPVLRNAPFRQYTVSYIDSSTSAGVVPQVNGVSYMATASPLYAWSSTNTTSSHRLLTYPLAVYLPAGGTFQLIAAAADNVISQQFSAHYVGDTVTGFSVRYTGNYSVNAQESLFANSAAGRTTLYSQGGGYTENGYTAPVAGTYQVGKAEG